MVNGQVEELQLDLQASLTASMTSSMEEPISPLDTSIDSLDMAAHLTELEASVLLTMAPCWTC